MRKTLNNIEKAQKVVSDLKDQVDEKDIFMVHKINVVDVTLTTTKERVMALKEDSDIFLGPDYNSDDDISSNSSEATITPSREQTDVSNTSSSANASSDDSDSEEEEIESITDQDDDKNDPTNESSGPSSSAPSQNSGETGSGVGNSSDNSPGQHSSVKPNDSRPIVDSEKPFSTLDYLVDKLLYIIFIIFDIITQILSEGVSLYF